MVDQLTRVKELLALLQDGRMGGSRDGVVGWLDEHEADVRELADLKGNAVAEQFLGLRSNTIGPWRTRRNFTDPPAEARRKAAQRRKELQEAMDRLWQAKPDLETMQPRRWLDAHRDDVELALSFGQRESELADSLGTMRQTFAHWCRDRQVIAPREEEVVAVQSSETPEEELTPQPPGGDGPPLPGLTSKQLQNEMAKDINSLGLEKAWDLWHGRGLTRQRWAVNVNWARKQGLIPPKAEATAQAKATPRAADRYLQGKYDGMREALLIIFGGKESAPD